MVGRNFIGYSLVSNNVLHLTTGYACFHLGLASRVALLVSSPLRVDSTRSAPLGGRAASRRSGRGSRFVVYIVFCKFNIDVKYRKIRAERSKWSRNETTVAKQRECNGDATSKATRDPEWSRREAETKRAKRRSTGNRHHLILFLRLRVLRLCLFLFQHLFADLLLFRCKRATHIQ